MVFLFGSILVFINKIFFFLSLYKNKWIIKYVICLGFFVLGLEFYIVFCLSSFKG